MATIKQWRADADTIVRGEVAPARVHTLEPDGKGGFVRRPIEPEEFRRRQAVEAAAARVPAICRV